MKTNYDRRDVLKLTLAAVLAGTLWSVPARGQGADDGAPADLVVTNALVTTLDDANPEATAFAVRGDRFVAVGTDADVRLLVGGDTTVLDAGGRRVIPGLNDSHLHATRGGRFYNLELRWDGVESLERGLEMIREQATRTPPGQWVRVVGGWSPYQFIERRMPTVAELNAAAPDVPVFVMFLYSSGFLNRAGVESLGITADTPAPTGGRYELLPDAEGGGAILHAEPNPMILYQTVDALPKLSAEDEVNSTRHFYRELNRLGLTSAVDAGGGGHLFPGDYAATAALAADDDPAIPLRLSMYLFAQTAGEELAAYQKWSGTQRLHLNMAAARLNGYVVEGAGENLTAAAADYENFMAGRPELNPDKLHRELTAVTRFLAGRGWPIRIHATYDQTVGRVLDVFEPVFREQGYAARWAIDHAETISDANIARVKRLGGGVAVQNRMAFAGEFFLDRYGPEAAASAPPLRKLYDAGLPLGAGTDGTRVSSYNPWVSLYWMTSSRTVGGTLLYPPENRLTRAEALRLYTVGSAWFSGEEAEKGRVAPGQLADFAVLSDDYLAVPEERIKAIESVLTVVGGDVVHAAGPFAGLTPEPPPVSPAWSPVAHYGGVGGP